MANSIFGTGDRISRQETKQLPNESKLENVNIGEMAVTNCFAENIVHIKHNVYAENPTVMEDMSNIINKGCRAGMSRWLVPAILKEFTISL